MLRAWEHGRRRHPIDRAVMLHALAEPALDPDRLPDAPLGDRNAAILRLRQATFGDRLRAVLDCPRCGERLELDADTTTLLSASAGAEASVEVEGLRFRPPTSRDLIGILGESDAEAARLRLLRLCLIGDGDSADPVLLASLGDRVEDALEQADSLADLTFGFVCDACGHEWQASIDVAAFLWDEVDLHARRLLDEVHVLARAYGWSEAEILALPEERRLAYIERVTS